LVAESAETAVNEASVSRNKKRYFTVSYRQTKAGSQ
jgi:hypothetical protein